MKTTLEKTFLLLTWALQLANAQQFDNFKTPKTGELCDVYLGNLRNQSKEPDICSDCILRVYTIQFSSPLGCYDEILQQFSSIKSKCGTAAATYTYTKTAYSTSPATDRVTPTTSTTRPGEVTSTTRTKASAKPTPPPLTLRPEIYRRAK
ncbi:hypothetical protein B0H66DRAFT_613972 [Apodospora peruviana]|uniref:Uncharacterized protein n=1 Tax=Apodospora peruviana TaxID=516989 RepID=A0AAE0IV18_9PEZI|nr:hypothetical protein B0H66DRAFT_613972 [Apodospora peruviana]